MSIEVSLADRVSIHELAARYGNVIDDRSWDRLGEVFCEDATYQMVGFGGFDDSLTGLVAIRAMLAASVNHPVAHHVTNVEVRVADGDVWLLFKVLGPGRRGRVGSVDYVDTVRKESRGWRIATHRATRRQPSGDARPDDHD